MASLTLLLGAVPAPAVPNRAQAPPPAAAVAPAPAAGLSPDPVLDAAGLSPDPVLDAAGDVATCNSLNDSKTAALLGAGETVAPIGDLTYNAGSDFANCYDPTWGVAKARTRPALGDHEYIGADAVTYFKYFGAAAGTNAGGYYSYDLGTWHIIVLNSTCHHLFGGCAAGSPQESWLRSDLAAHPASCTLAYWHAPLFTSGQNHAGSLAVAPLYQALYDSGAEVVLNADNRQYERFAPQTPDGVADTAHGIREFVVGTGGHALNGFSNTQPNSEVRNASTFGVLKLTLSAGSYSWRFVPVAGKTFTDAGTGVCHGPQRTCLTSGTDVDINAALTGAGSEARLCRGATFLLDNPVRFTAANQRIDTDGLPMDANRATLQIRSPLLSTAIDTNNKSGVVISNIQVDGARPTLGHLQGGALVEMGAAAVDQTIQNVVARNTRSWSTIHIGEGPVVNNTPQCQRATVVNNTVGPAGTPDQNQWADGISLACGNSLVKGNTVVDATDGAIVIFGAPGSRIEGNTITALTQLLLGGINLVDYNPVNGNYTGTVVTGNTVDARSAVIDVGIAMGPPIWYCVAATNYGASVTGNMLRGKFMVYGLAAAGIKNWEVAGNTDHATHIPFIAAGCGGLPVTPLVGP